MFKKTYGYSGPAIKARQLNIEDVKEKVISQLKTSLFEIKDFNVELKLESVEADLANLSVRSNEDYYDEIHGRWLMINGNTLKKENLSRDSSRKTRNITLNIQLLYIFH